MKKDFSSHGIFKEAYLVMKPSLWLIIKQYGLLLSTCALFLALSGGNLLLVTLLISLCAYFSVTFAMSYIEHGTFHYGDLFEKITFKKFVYYYCASTLTTLALFGGLILLFLPAVIVLIQLIFVKFILVEKEMSPMKALHESARLTKGFRLKLFEFSVFALILNVIGVAALIVGVFFTLPLTVIALRLLYVKLSRGVEEGEDGPTITVEAKAA